MNGSTGHNPIQKLLRQVHQRDGEQKEFIQAVEEVITSLAPLLEREPKYAKVLSSLVEPERVVMFRVPWLDDHGHYRVNRGFRIQMNSALGPYKGGLRFHPSVTLSVMKFLAFEQTFKNSLTSLSMGGAKGGSDFDPKGKSDNEVMRFCQSFMSELHKHIGPETDVPAGDIGVGTREIGYLFGQYKRLTGTFSGAITGKSLEWGGSHIRPEATGYGLVYYLGEILQDRNESLRGKKVLLSGSGNVSQYTAEKLNELGAIVLTMSDSNGYLLEENGIAPEKLETIMHLKNEKRGRLSEYTHISQTSKYVDGLKPWHLACDIAIPAATENEITEEDAKQLVENGCKYVIEGANMPCTAAAVRIFQDNGVIFGPAKAANAGGVCVSGLEMAQNSIKMIWSREEVDQKLKDIMKNIYQNSKRAAKEYGRENDLGMGANIAGFIKVAEAMLGQGCV